jgi:hypothetical protein
MAHAYTPGLKVAENELLRKRRVLPLKGEVLVEPGAAVGPNDVVARTFLPGKVEIVNVANKMGVDQTEVPQVMLKKEGARVEEGEVIAASKSFFGLFKSQATSPLTGTVESISGVTGQVILQGEPEPVEMRAYVEGTIIEVIPTEGVVVETCGSFIQGIFGIGGEVSGEIVMACGDRTQVLDADLVAPDQCGKVIVGGSLVTDAALRKAIDLGVNGVVVGGFDDKDLREFLGYDLGVAITGHEQLGITLIVTEGFGRIDMAPLTFELLKRHVGERASINGATQIRAGVIRPEVIIPVSGAKAGAAAGEVGGGMQVGSPVRVIRNPYFGLLGTVTSLPSEPAVLESGSRARVVEVALEAKKGEKVVLPRANVELIEG